MKEAELHELWDKSMKLAADIYPVMRRYPRGELNVLCPEIQRSMMVILMSINKSFGCRKKEESEKCLDVIRRKLARMSGAFEFSMIAKYLDKDTHDEIRAQLKEIWDLVGSLMEDPEPAGGFSF